MVALRPCSEARRNLMRADGFTLVELVVTLTIGALVVLALARGLTVAFATGRTARATSQASAQARAAIESARGLGFSTLAHAPGSTDADPHVTAGTFDPDGSGPLPAEEIFEAGDASLLDHVSTETYAGITYTISTFVTDAAN